MALPYYEGQWVQLPGQYDEFTGRTTPGGWINTAASEYMTPIANDVYQANVQQLNPTMKYLAANGTAIAPTQEMLQKGSSAVLADMIKELGPTRAAQVSGLLGNQGYWDKFSDIGQTGDQIGSFTAKGQAAIDGGNAGPEGMLKGALIHAENIGQDAVHHPIAGMVGPIGGSAFGGESSNFIGQPSDETYADQQSQGVDSGASRTLNNFGATLGLAAGAAFAGGALGAGATGAEGAGAGGTAAAEGGAAAGGTAAGGLTGLESLGASAIPGGAGGATTAGTSGLAASSAAALPAAAAADPFGGGDNAAISGADYTGAADAGIGAGSITGAGAAAGTAGLSAASGGSGGGSSGGGSASGGGGLGGGSWLTDDQSWLAALARGVPGLLGALGAASQAEDYEDLAHQYQQMGEPYRNRLAQLYADPTAFLNSPEVRQPIQQGTDMLAHSLSVKGNPAGSGNALQELQNYASTQLFNRLGQEKDRLGGFGGLTAYNQAAPQAASNVIGAQGDIYSNLGGATADIFNPQRRYTLQDLLRAY